MINLVNSDLIFDGRAAWKSVFAHIIISTTPLHALKSTNDVYEGITNSPSTALKPSLLMANLPLFLDVGAQMP